METLKNDKHSFFKSMKYFGVTVLFMFTAPVIIYQAFKNQEHPFYIPVLVIGLIFAIIAVAFGFYSVKLLVDFIFKKSN